MTTTTTRRSPSPLLVAATLAFATPAPMGCLAPATPESQGQPDGIEGEGGGEKTADATAVCERLAECFPENPDLASECVEGFNEVAGDPTCAAYLDALAPVLSCYMAASCEDLLEGTCQDTGIEDEAATCEALNEPSFTDCVSDADCSDDEVCFDGICDADPTCESDADCFADEVCLDGFCDFDLTCESAADCFADEVCMEGICVFGDEGGGTLGTAVSECGTVLTVSGSYRLASDLNCPTGEAVTINGTDIEFSFDGHTITTGGGASVVILDSINAHVHGPGTAAGSGNSGIVINGGDQNRVDTLTLALNRVGVATIFSPTNSIIAELAITARAGDGEGIQLIDGSGTEVRQNVITGGAIGIHIFGTSSSNRLLQNGVDSATFGISVDGGSGSNTISSNIVSATSTDLIDNNEACGSNTWSSNTFTDAVPSECIQ